MVATSIIPHRWWFNSIYARINTLGAFEWRYSNRKNNTEWAGMERQSKTCQGRILSRLSTTLRACLIATGNFLRMKIPMEKLRLLLWLPRGQWEKFPSQLYSRRFCSAKNHGEQLPRKQKPTVLSLFLQPHPSFYLSFFNRTQNSIHGVDDLVLLFSTKLRIFLCCSTPITSSSM